MTVSRDEVMAVLAQVATPGGGDLVSLVAYLDGVRQPEAARRLAEFLGIDPISAVPAVPRSRGSKTTSKNSNLHAVEAGTAPGTAAGPAVPAAGPAHAWTPAPPDAPPPPARPRTGPDNRPCSHALRRARPSLRL